MLRKLLVCALYLFFFFTSYFVPLTYVYFINLKNYFKQRTYLDFTVTVILIKRIFILSTLFLLIAILRMDIS